MNTFASVADNELEGIAFMIPTAFGGRKTALHSGYRGQFFWHINGEQSTDWLAESYFEHDCLEPGESGKIKIKLGGSIIGLAKVTGMPVGRQFCLREGSKVVVVGVITESLYPNAQRGKDDAVDAS